MKPIQLLILACLMSTARLSQPLSCIKESLEELIISVVTEQSAKIDELVSQYFSGTDLVFDFGDCNEYTNARK